MAELYNKGLIREGLLRTTNLVLPGLIAKFDTLEEFLTRFAVNGVEAALALDFISSEYRLADTASSFDAAFVGNLETGVDARAYITAEYGWTFTDGGTAP